MLAATKGNTGTPNLAWGGRSGEAATTEEQQLAGPWSFFLFPKAGPVAGESNSKIEERNAV